jgi:hypothetical protein
MIFKNKKEVISLKGKCAKQEMIAIIENKGQYWIGSKF